MPPKAKGKGKGKTVPERSVPPNATFDPISKEAKKQYVENEKKEMISVFQEELDLKKTEYITEMEKTKGKIRLLLKDNERLRRKQAKEYGITLDNIYDLKQEIERLKVENNKLYHQMEEAKTLHDKLEGEQKIVHEKFSETVATYKELKKETRSWSGIQENLLKSESRCNNLVNNNRKLRLLLLKHHIHPSSDVSEMDRDEEEVRDSPRSHQVTMKPYRQKLTVKSRFITTDDIDELRRMNTDDLKKGYGIMHSTLDQVSPAYLGYYLRRRSARKEKKDDYYRPGLTLPRIFAKPNLLY